MFKTYMQWLIEFFYTFAIAFILSTRISNYFLVIPILFALFIKKSEYNNKEKVELKCLQAQLIFIDHYLRINNFRNIRCTFHKVRGKKFYQVLDYIPTGGGGGREFNLDKGIIGKSFRNKESFVENFANDVEYRDKMIKDYGYNELDIMKRKMDRRSYFCYPLISENHDVLGVIYFDSDIVNTFPSIDNTNIETLISFLERIKDHLI